MVAEGVTDPAGGGTTPDIVPGGGRYKSLDLTDTKDAGMLRQAVKRWPKRFARMNAEAQDEVAGAVVEALRITRSQLTDPDQSGDAMDRVAKLGSVAASMVRIQQADDHAEVVAEQPNHPTIIVIQPPPRARLD